MPRPVRRRPKSAPRQAPPRQSRQASSLVAAGGRVTTKPGNKPKAGTVAQGWQDEAWYFHDTVGELAQAALWVGNSLSRCTLDCMEVKADGSLEPTTNPAALQAMADLFDGDTGQSDMLATLGVHFTVPGESYLVGVPPQDPFSMGPDRWRVLSNKEIRQQAGKWIIDRGDGIEERYADGTKPDEPAECMVIRIWRPHPAMWVQAQSPCRAALPVLRQLEKVTQSIASAADSRLAGAGIFVIPKGAVWETPTNPEGANVEDPTAQSSTMADLAESMLTPIGDRGNAAARVPIIMSLPDDLADKVQHITFGLPFDEQSIPLSDHSIRRLATALDMPVEALLGQGDSNHWSAWLISEEGIKVHIEPLLGLLVTALTQKYLWPILAGGEETLDGDVPPEVKRYVIKGNTSALRQRPDMTDQAMDLHGKMVLTDAALAREVGFDVGDVLVPGSEEFKRRLLMKIAAGVTTGDQTQAALVALGVDLTPQPSEVTPPAAPDGPAAVAAPPAPEPAALPARGTPDRAESVAASALDPATVLASAASMRQTVAAAMAARNGPQVAQYSATLAVADLAVSRALERANARLFGRGKGTRRPVTGERVDEALRDAWTLLPSAAEALGVDPAVLQSGCDRYTRELLGRGMEHNRDLLGAVVKGLLTGDLVA